MLLSPEESFAEDRRPVSLTPLTGDIRRSSEVSADVILSTEPKFPRTEKRRCSHTVAEITIIISGDYWTACSLQEI